MFALRSRLFTSSGLFSSALARSMEKHGVVPDVIDVAPGQVSEVMSIINVVFNFIDLCIKYGNFHLRSLIQVELK